jgi:hypothetical protein
MHRRGTAIFLYAAASFLAFPLQSVLAASAGVNGASFLDIPVGAAPAAMGSAYSARATDAYAPVWNPAGLGFLDGIHVSATHLSYLQSVNYEYFGLAIPLDGPPPQQGMPPPPRPGLGVSVQYLGSGSISAYDQSGNPAGSFSTTFAAYSLAFAEPVTDEWSLGVTGKYVTESISDASADALAIDLGSLYRVNDRLSLAAVLSNLGSSVKFADQSDPLPLNLRAGAFYQFNPRFGASAEAVYRDNGPLGVRGGLEWIEQKVFIVRLGGDSSHTNGLSALSALTVGAGIRLSGCEFSYAWVPYGDAGSTNYFSLDLRFGPWSFPKRFIKNRPPEVVSESSQPEPAPKQLRTYKPPKDWSENMKKLMKENQEDQDEDLQ